MWLQDFIAQNPERVIDNKFSLAQPTFENIPVYYEHIEQDSPAFPLTRPVPVGPHKALKKSTSKTSNTSKSSIKEDFNTTQERSNTTQNHSTHNNNATEPDSHAESSCSNTERSFHNANTNFASSSPAHTTAGISNPLN